MISATPVNKITISPRYASDNTVFGVVIDSGIHKTTNGGQTWTLVMIGSVSNMSKGLEISPNYVQDKTFYAGTADGPVLAARALRALPLVRHGWHHSHAHPPERGPSQHFR